MFAHAVNQTSHRTHPVRNSDTDEIRSELNNRELFQETIDVVESLAEGTWGDNKAALFFHRLVNKVHRTQLKRLVIALVNSCRLYKHLRDVLFHLGEKQTRVTLSLSLGLFR
mgnify:CR=1 FL=1